VATPIAVTTRRAERGRFSRSQREPSVAAVGPLTRIGGRRPDAGPVGYSIDIRASVPEAEFPERRVLPSNDSNTERRRRLTTKLGLAIAGVSLHRAPEGRWFLLRGQPVTRLHRLRGGPWAEDRRGDSRTAGSRMGICKIKQLARLVKALPAIKSEGARPQGGGRLWGLLGSLAGQTPQRVVIIFSWRYRLRPLKSHPRSVPVSSL
jgi:hypothetical protein